MNKNSEQSEPTNSLASSNSSTRRVKQKTDRTVSERLVKVEPDEKLLLCKYSRGCGNMPDSQSGLCSIHEIMKGVTPCKVLGCSCMANIETGGFCREHTSTSVNENISSSELPQKFESTDTTQSDNIVDSGICQVASCGAKVRKPSQLCKSHDFNRRRFCQDASGCSKAAQGPTNFCKAHGGGRRCEFPYCKKSSEGSTRFCVAHGGGRRCSILGCPKSAQGRTLLCKAHGGGRRCAENACTKSAQGSTQFCKRHGGGKRCLIEGCPKSARGSTSFCISHGGGKRCSHTGCGSSAVGKTPLCIRHGGGKRCAAPNCTKCARGRSDFCMSHGTALKAMEENAADSTASQSSINSFSPDPRLYANIQYPYPDAYFQSMMQERVSEQMKQLINWQMQIAANLHMNRQNDSDISDGSKGR